MGKLVSLIVPVYNVEKYLPSCIESIMAQSYENLEIILVDDGSTDSSGDICDKYSKIDNRIKVIHKENQGVSAARNRGLQNSNGHYIGFIDSDDYIEKDMIKTLVGNIKKYNSNISICGYKIFYDNTEKIKLSDTDKHTLQLSSEEALEIIFKTNKINGFLWNKLFEKEIIKNELLDENIDLCEDLLMVCKLVKKSSNICYTSKILYNYRNSLSSITLNVNKLFSDLGVCRYNYAYELLEEEFYENYNILNIIRMRKIKTVMESYYLSIKARANNYTIDKYTFVYLKKNFKKYIINTENSMKQKSIFLGIFIVCKVNSIISYYRNR